MNAAGFHYAQGQAAAPLSTRLRPNIECAPWVIEAVKRLEVERDWYPITATEPAPLVDVLVSAYDASDRAGIVFMAWRNKDGTWMLSSGETPLLLPVYAYQQIMAPAPPPAAQQVAA